MSKSLKEKVALLRKITILVYEMGATPCYLTYGILFLVVRNLILIHLGVFSFVFSCFASAVFLESVALNVSFNLQYESSYFLQGFLSAFITLASPFLIQYRFWNFL